MYRLVPLSRAHARRSVLPSSLPAQSPQSMPGASAPAGQPAAARAAVAGDPDVLGAERLFSAWMEGQIAYRGLPGIVVGVVNDQELVWGKGFGFADINAKLPMTPATKFRMASHSKLFTAIAIMQLREEGKLRLDDPVAKYLSWFKAKPAGDDDGPITIEQLLSHSSGLQREAGDHWTSFEFPTADELRHLYADRQAAFAPSVRWKYSNLAYSVAGMIIEQVSGQRWADYVDRHIFTPLGMLASSVDKNVPGLAVPYGRRMPDGTREVLPFVDARGMAAATGVTSNARRHGEVRFGPVPQRPARRGADREHRIAARDASRALGGGELDLGDRASASTSLASRTGPTSGMAAAIPATRPRRSFNSTTKWVSSSSPTPTTPTRRTSRGS